MSTVDLLANQQNQNNASAYSNSNFSSTTSFTSQSTYKPSQVNKWKKVNDPKTGRDYWYHTDTKETTWTMPDELQKGNQSGAAHRLSQQMAVMGMGQSEMQLNTNAWESSEDNEVK